MFKQHYHIFILLIILALQFQFLLPVKVESVSHALMWQISVVVHLLRHLCGPSRETPKKTNKQTKCLIKFKVIK